MFMKSAKGLVCSSLFMGLAGVAIASAGARYSIHIAEPVTVAGTELNPGDYRMELDGEKATIHAGKSSVATNVKTEEGATKYIANGKYKLSEIHLRGTRMKIVFNE